MNSSIETNMTGYMRVTKQVFGACSYTRAFQLIIDLQYSETQFLCIVLRISLLFAFLCLRDAAKDQLHAYIKCRLTGMVRSIEEPHSGKGGITRLVANVRGITKGNRLQERTPNYLCRVCRRQSCAMRISQVEIELQCRSLGGSKNQPEARKCDPYVRENKIWCKS